MIWIFLAGGTGGLDGTGIEGTLRGPRGPKNLEMNQNVKLSSSCDLLRRIDKFEVEEFSSAGRIVVRFHLQCLYAV